MQASQENSLGKLQSTEKRGIGELKIDLNHHQKEKVHPKLEDTEKAHW